MNVIVSNLNANKFLNLDVDIIKSINGEFTAEEIVQSFSNFFFNRMFLDITAIQDYQNVSNIQKLSNGLDVSKIIVLLSDDLVVNSESYIAKLIEIGIYNFSKEANEIKYFYDNPRDYNEVSKLQNINHIPVSSPIIEPMKSMEYTINESKMKEFDESKHGAKFIIKPKEKTDNFEQVSSSVRVIGFKNFTSHAGATSLIYMLKKQLSKNYFTVAIEINKRDFLFFNDESMVSCKASELSNYLMKYKDANVVLVDLNDLDVSMSRSLCDEVIYLMESSTLKLNKLVMLDSSGLQKIASEKVILNNSLLDQKDIHILQKESGISFYSVFPPMNDRADNSEILFPFLEKLGLYRRVS